jgi:hypothetical protein
MSCLHRRLQIKEANVIGDLNQYRCRDCGILLLLTEPHVNADARLIPLWTITPREDHGTGR